MASFFLCYSLLNCKASLQSIRHDLTSHKLELLFSASLTALFFVIQWHLGESRQWRKLTQLLERCGCLQQRQFHEINISIWCCAFTCIVSHVSMPLSIQTTFDQSQSSFCFKKCSISAFSTHFFCRHYEEGENVFFSCIWQLFFFVVIVYIYAAAIASLHYFFFSWFWLVLPPLPSLPLF